MEAAGPALAAGTAAPAAPPVSRARLVRVEVRDFRNLHRVDVAPPVEGMILVGENGQGKTNFLEAIHYLQLLRSFRGARDTELVNFEARAFYLAADLADARARTVSAGFERSSKRKRVLVDGGETDRLTDALGAFPAVLFSPRDGGIVAGAAAARRRLLDVMLALSARPYLVALQRYRTALAQRGAAMRQPGPAARVEQSVAVWETPLAESGAVLWLARRAWVDAHRARYAELCRGIGERGTAAMRYVSSVAAGAADPGALRDALRDALARHRAADIRRGLTHAGPHRDDLALSLDGRELRTYGSAGQQRTAAIALRLLEADTRRAAAGSEPIILLDDPFAELDAGRSLRILELLSAERSGQIVLAVPRDGDIPLGLTQLARHRVTAGAITPAAGAA
ncbi:MAG TPA: DNA replication and repair protein RecF [Gemmatimonadaceae bacterium]